MIKLPIYQLPKLSLVTLLLVSGLQAQTAETWLGLPLNPSVLTLQKEGVAKRAPNSTAAISSASLTNLAAGTGVRVRAVVTPTVTGAYTFAVAGGNNAALWLSTDASGFNKQAIAWQFETSTVQQWTKFASQQSAPITLTAGVAYYLEAQVMSNLAGGHLEIGWKPPGSTTMSLIPIAQLSSIAPNTEDQNGNNLPDSFEAQTGLDQSTLPGALSEYGDPDNDGITNFNEFRLGSNPLVKEAVSNGITREIWREIQSQAVTGLTGARSRFLSYPNAVDHAPSVDETRPNSIDRKNYGARYRGFLVAPVTGTYHLWIAGDDDSELWFSDGSVMPSGTTTGLSNRFGKQLLAHTHNPGGSYSNVYRDFDLLPSQRTRELHLVQGQTYYIEVLHKNESIAASHVSLAWKTPGQARVIIPTSAFESDIPEDSDKDNDWLPDTWETSMGLSPIDNGITSAKEGERGDYDADGLSNLLEFQLGTKPKLADTDGDGLSDGQEVNYYHSNPLVSDTIATTHYGAINLQNQSATSFAWQNNTDGTITAYDRRGWIEWPITIAPGKQGIYEIQLVASISPSALTIPLSFHIDEQLIDKRTHALKTTPNTSAPIKLLTPFLSVGTHTLRIYNHNARADFKLKLHSLNLYRLGGNDVNANGIPDWVENQYNEGNQLTVIPSQSLTSPAYIEGVSSLPSDLRLSYYLPDADPTPLDAELSINNGFFARVPLDAGQVTQLDVSFQNGEQTQSHPITWTATNILEHSALTIRKGDSLRLTAHDPNSTPEGSFTLEASAGGPSVPTESIASDQPLEVIFDTPGVHTLTATWTPSDGPSQTATLTLTVRSADFGSTFVLQTYNRRTWQVSGVQDLQVEADDALFWSETTAQGASSRSFLTNAYNAGEYRVIARCPDTGKILGVGRVSVFSLTRAGASYDAQVVETRADGSSVLRFTITGENLPSNLEIRLHMQYQGSIFPDGSRDFVLHSYDFSANGVADVLVETSSNPPNLCHSMYAVLID